MRKLPTLETRRRVLRPFLLSDAATVQRLAGDRAVADTTLAITEPEAGLVGAISLRIYAQHFARNPASGRVMAKVGMQLEGTLRRHIYRWDQPEDVEAWGLLRSDAPGSP